MSKTIQINPSLFNVGGNLSKTKKNREIKQKPIITPLITPNALKNKLLKRIKEHKNKEMFREDEDNKKNTIRDIGIYTDEFNDSIDYLKSLSTEKKNQQREQDLIYNKTIKNRSAFVASPQVKLELPETLKEEHLVPVEIPIPLEEVKINTSILPDPLYGCLRGGKKPTYKTWIISQNNREVNNPNLSIIATNNPNNERENRLKMLQEKIKIKQQEKASDDIIMSKNLIKVSREDPIKPISNPNSITNTSPNITNDEPMISNKEELIQKYTEEAKEDSSRRLIKKTIHRKYILGKSIKCGKVGILIKDRNTRKNILRAQKELKKKPINDVKQYLREHSLIKIGSNAPNDVVRKIYESAMLSGEITNNNKDILYHNFIKTANTE